MRSLSTIDRAVDTLTDALMDKPFAVTGFYFVIDEPDSENELTLDATQQMPNVKGFLCLYDGVLYEHKD